MYCRQVFQKPLFIKRNYIIKACNNDDWSYIIVRFYKPVCSFLVLKITWLGFYINIFGYNSLIDYCLYTDCIRLMAVFKIYMMLRKFILSQYM